MTEPIIRTERVVKRFGEETVALDGVDIAIEPGIIYGLLGPNGAGKTTLIRVLTTLLKPDAGRAWVAGIDVCENPAGVRSRIGLAGQYAAVDGFLTGRENVEMVGRLYGLSGQEARARAREVLERIRLDDAADRPVRTYSGGMRRRLDLAASLVGRPEVLFLDEPTTGIDPRSRIDIWDIIQDLVSGGTTLLLTTQYLEEADYLADRIGVIDHGHLIEEGTADELKHRVGGAVIEACVPDDQLEAAKRVLAEVAGVEPQFDTIREGLVIPAADGSRTLMELVRRFDAVGIEPQDLQLHKPTLDDVFLTLTGRVATEETETEPSPEPAGRRPAFFGGGRR